MLWALFSSYFFRNEKKEYSTPQTSFLMLEANKANALLPHYDFLVLTTNTTNIVITFHAMLDLILADFRLWTCHVPTLLLTLVLCLCI